MIREMKLEQCKRELRDFKHRYLAPLYGNGPLGAQFVFSQNKCMTSYKICDSPNDVDRNLRRLQKLRELCESQEETNIIESLYSLYINYIRIKENRLNLLDEKLNNINRIYLELKRFDTFKEDQDVFDNYISLLKMQERLNSFVDINIDFKPKFISNKTTSAELEKEFKKEITYMFSNMIFKYNISNEYNKIESEIQTLGLGELFN